MRGTAGPLRAKLKVEPEKVNGPVDRLPGERAAHGRPALSLQAEQDNEAMQPKGLKPPD